MAKNCKISMASPVQSFISLLFFVCICVYQHARVANNWILVEWSLSCGNLSTSFLLATRCYNIAPNPGNCQEGPHELWLFSFCLTISLWASKISQNFHTFSSPLWWAQMSEKGCKDFFGSCRATVFLNDFLPNLVEGQDLIFHAFHPLA